MEARATQPGNLEPGRDPAVHVEHCCKEYVRGRPAYGSLRDTVSRLLIRGRVPPVERVRALEDVTFDVQRGEMLGVVGDNGAGKSTLLKILARITPPDRGCVEIRGRLSSLIEIGAGFHPELTGRENVLLHGSILGLRRRILRQAMGDIAQFAGLDGAMDTPVKFFSTGMYARLGFAVAVHATPQVLLVDEVLSVGDIAFRERCYDRIRTVKSAGTAIVFVSHDLQAVRTNCDRALHLAGGRIVATGAPERVVGAYESAATGDSP